MGEGQSSWRSPVTYIYIYVYIYIYLHRDLYLFCIYNVFVFLQVTTHQEINNNKSWSIYYKSGPNWFAYINPF